MKIEAMEHRKTEVSEVTPHKIVSKAAWLVARTDLLKREIFHTYSTYGRGGEQFLGVYGYLDVMPKGRNENAPYHSLTDWARPKNMYGNGGMVEANGRYHAPSCACTVHKS